MENKSDKLIILDLDETLIHATEVELNVPFDFKFDGYFVYERPYLRQFLSDIARHFSIGIWSSAGDDYVNAIVRHIKPDGVDFVVVWGRSKCSVKRDLTFDTYCFEKRLHKLKKRGFRLERVLVVDDSPSKSRTNYGNAIYIKEFTGDTSDRELQFLYGYLLRFKTTGNVRTIEKRGWRQ